MDPLATLPDLEERSPETAVKPAAMSQLAAASEAIRDAAGCAISRETSTTKILAPMDSQYVTLPAAPVISVSSVTAELDSVSGWRLLGGSLWLGGAWRPCVPQMLTVTFTHGYDVVPADIVDLTCALAAQSLGGEYGATVGITSTSESIDDYQHTTSQDADSVTPIVLPDATRTWLRGRFSSAVLVTGSR